MTHPSDTTDDPPGGDGGDRGAAGTAADEAAIAERLRDVAVAEVRAGLGLSVYLRRHLVEHALAGGVFDARHVPDEVLAHLDLTAVQESISRHVVLGDGLPALPVLRQVAHRWRDGDPDFNAALLDVWATLRGRPFASAVGRWWSIGSAVGPIDESVVLGRHGSDVWAVGTSPRAEVSLAATGSGDGTVRLWNLLTGTRERLWATHRRPVVGVGLIRLPEAGLVVVSAGADGVVQTYDITSDTPRAASPVDLARPITAMALAAGDGAAFVVTGHRDGTLRRWTLDARARPGDAVVLGQHADGSATGVTALAVMQLPGGPICLSAADDGTVRGWNLADLEPLGAPVLAHADPVQVMTAFSAASGQILAVSGGRDKMLQVWESGPDGEPVRKGEPFRAMDTVGALAALPVRRGEPQLIAVGVGHRLGFWDVDHRSWVGEPRTGPDGSVSAVAATTVDGRTVVVTGDRDDTVRLWEARSAHDRPDGARAGLVEAIAVGALRGDPVAVTPGQNGGLYRWNLLLTDSPAVELDVESDGVLAVAICDLPGTGSVALAASFDGRIRRVTLDGAGGAALSWPGHRAPVVDMAVVSLSGRPALATAGWDNTIRLWDVGTGAEVRAPIRLRTREIRSMAITHPDGTSPVAVCGGHDGVVERWDLRRGTPYRPESRSPDRRITRVACAGTGAGLMVLIGDEGGVVADAPLDDPVMTFVERTSVAGGVVALESLATADGHPVFAVAGSGPEVRLHDVRGHQLGAALPTPGSVKALAGDPARPGTVLVAGAGILQATFRGPGREPRS